MAIPDFSITGITQAAVDAVKPVLDQFNSAVNTITAPDEKAQGVQAKLKNSAYHYDTLHFPSDLGQGKRHPYYMTFYINVQDLSKYDKGAFKGPTPPRVATQTVASTGRTLAKNVGSTSLGFGRKTHRTAMAIRLYMPDTLSWSYANSFRDVSLSGLSVAGLPVIGLAQAVSSIPALSKSMSESHEGGSIMGLLSSLNKSNAARAAIGPLAEIAGNALLGEGGDRIVLSAAGVAINPQVDVIYESPALREFAFDFLFAPRDLQEATAVEDIVRAFKFHSAPEILGKGIGIGRYFVPPSEFNIEFSVSTMGKISVCVLQTVTVDYAPSGAAFYRDGKPVYTRLTLQFKELEFMTKELLTKERGF